LDSEARAFCCEGCAAAAEWIIHARLGNYYELRSANASRVGNEQVDLNIWDRAEILQEHAHPVEGGLEVTLLTDGMRCAACAWLIDRALSRETGILGIVANAVTGRIRIAWDPQATRLSQVLDILVKLGYRPYLATGQSREQQRRAERKQWVLRLGIAGLGMMQAMMLAESLYLDFGNAMPIPTRDFFRWITFLVATPVVFYSGWPFLSGCWRELKQRHLGMDTLIAGSTLLAYFASLYETIREGPHVWYDAAVMFVFFLLTARMLEQSARNAATAQVDALARARPAFATREGDDGSRESVPLGVLEVGDIACVAAGDNVPADGELLDDDAVFEEALLTGESHPVHKSAGAMVYAGTVCHERPARIRVTNVGSTTRLSQLTRLVDQAQAHRPRIARIADRIGSRFVVSLLLATVVVYVFWHYHMPERALEVTLSLLVISCPCALSLSVPAAVAAAHGTLAKMGVLATRPDALDTLSKATDIVFDKTGTLSDGHPALVQIETFHDFDREYVLAVAAALERDTGHPIATAFADVSEHFAVENVTTVTGQGVEGVVDERYWRLGQAGFAASAEVDGGLWLGDGVRGFACFHLRETARPDARSALTALCDQKRTVHLSSGDSVEAVQNFAESVGIAGPLSRQAPEDKLNLVRELQAKGRIVAMVGDGLNDAPVLAGADVSLAMGEGAPLAQHAADLVITGNSLMRIPATIDLAERTQHIIKQNLSWAVAYNVLALPLAAAGMVTPWIAALGMALSSLIVTLNALRLTRVSKSYIS
jgi:Cu2+-exporting ATPase